MAASHSRAARPDVADVPRFLHPHIRNYRSKAFEQLDPAGFARLDGVYQHGRDAACHWLRCALAAA